MPNYMTFRVGTPVVVLGLQTQAQAVIEGVYASLFSPHVGAALVVGILTCHDLNIVFVS